MGRLELPASCSQSKRATNCATPGYGIFQLWSNMGSTPVFDQFQARGKTPSALASQSFPGFWRSAARTPASRSQSKRATNCATPGYKVAQRILASPSHSTLNMTGKLYAPIGPAKQLPFYYTAFSPYVKCSNISDDFFLAVEYNTPIYPKSHRRDRKSVV